jgi:phosphatidate cytidylyltransferase
MAEADGSSGQGLRRGWLSSELGARVASAVILAAVALFATYQGGWLFALLWLIAGVGVLQEWTGMARLEPRWTLQLALAAGLVALAIARVTSVPFTAGAAIFVLAIALAGLLGATVRDRLWGAAAFTAAGVLTLVPPAVRDDPAFGIVGVLWMFAVVWTADIVAYFTGRRFGGPKLWPRVSPKKTWSGFAGGLAAGTAAGVAVPLIAARWGWTQPIGTLGIALISILASAVGQAGDLAESALKRYFGVKDSGQLIPGHGGVMDRLDAFWAVACLTGLGFMGARLGD